MTPRPHDATAVWHARIRDVVRIVAVVALAGILWPAAASAQPIGAAPRTISPTPLSSPAGSKAVASGEHAAVEAANQTTFGLVRPEDGALLPLPAGTRYDDFLAWLAARRGPGYGINSVKMTGQTGEDGPAEIEAEIVVVVHRDDEWVRVPLGFAEATLVGFEHSGSGLVSYEGSTKETGQSWSFEGRGEHRLQLKLLVPVAERSGETRLSLTTPANAAVTNLSLKLPSDPSVLANAGIVRSTFSADQQTTVDWVGPGGRIDLSWRPQIAAARPADLAAATVIIPSINGKSVQLRAVQTVTPSNGQVSSIRTRLPTGFTLEGVTGSLYRSYSEETVDGGRIVTVQLTEATSKAFELTYRANSPLPSDGSFTIEGFSLPDVPQQAQSGSVQFERSNGYSIQPTDHSESVQKIEMLQPAPVAVSSAFAFTAQPFHLNVKAEPIPPSIAVTPKLEFQVLSDRIDLEGNFDVEVRKGELREIRLSWPSSDWVVRPIQAGPIQEFSRTMDAGALIEIGVSTTKSTFPIPIRASRPRDAKFDRLTVPLPKLEGTIRQQAEVIANDSIISLRLPMNLIVKVTSNGIPLKRVDAQGQSSVKVEATDGGSRLQYLAPANATELVFEIERLNREVTASTNLSMRPRGDLLQVEERIRYDVKYEPLTTLQLSAPESLIKQNLAFVDEAQQPVKATFGKPDEGRVSITLDLNGTLGLHNVSTRFEVPRTVPVGKAGGVPLPVIVPVDVSSRGVMLDASPFRKHALRVVDPGWVRLQLTEPDGHERWASASAGDSIALDLQPKSDEELPAGIVSRLLLRSLVRRDGNVVTYADYLFEQLPNSVTVRVPKGLKADSFTWRGKPVPAAMFTDDGDALAELDLEQVAAIGPPILTVGYRESGEATGLADRRALQTVSLEGCSVREMLWQLTLPESQHLFLEPSDYEPRFRWALGGDLIWSRRPSELIAEWFGTDVPAISPEFEVGHRYEFVRAGRPKPFEFSSISRSLVVLIGAGTAILLGYAFANGLIVRRRRVLVAVVVMLLMAWAFFPNQVQIFLQPAAFGLALVAIAAIAEWLLQRRQDRLSTSTHSAVDFVTILPGEGSNSTAPSAIGSEEPTVVRTSRSPETVGSHHGSTP